MITKLLHIVLSFSVLLSSAGILVNHHFCNGDHIDSAVFVKAKTCGHQEENAMPPDCPFHPPQKQQEHEKGCCEESADLIKLEQDQEVVTTVLPKFSVPLILTAAFFQTDLFSVPSFLKKAPKYLNYKPPLITADLPVSLQSFLL